MLVNTITISYLKKGKVQISLSLWKCKKRKEPPIRTTNSIIFPLLNEKPFSFHETVVVSSTTNRPFEDNFYTIISHLDFSSILYIFLLDKCFSKKERGKMFELILSVKYCILKWLIWYLLTNLQKCVSFSQEWELESLFAISTFIAKKHAFIFMAWLWVPRQLQKS